MECGSGKVWGVGAAEREADSALLGHCRGHLVHNIDWSEQVNRVAVTNRDFMSTRPSKKALASLAMSLERCADVRFGRNAASTRHNDFICAGGIGRQEDPRGYQNGTPGWP